MKVYQDIAKPMTPNLVNALNDYRQWRNFDVHDYIEKKIIKINNYFSKCKITSPVIAVSGGIDSAITLALIHAASQVEDSTIQRIVPVLLPTSGNGATFQEESVIKGQELSSKFGLKSIIIDIAPISDVIQNSVEQSLQLKGDDWAKGQLTAYSRTPTLYYITSILSAQNERSVICGTTNLDEGSYLGYVGKASDGMVDVQLISDIHKSEVFSVAKALSIPDSIIYSTPSGDMYDGRYDEEVFGASYDFVELYLYYLSMTEQEKNIFHQHYIVTDDDKNTFNISQCNLDSLHQYNAHKYWVGSPAVHLDIESLIYFKKEKYGWGIEL